MTETLRSNPGSRQAPSWAEAPALQEDEFRLFVRFIRESAGIHLPDAKQALVSGRLLKRLKHLGLNSYRAYFDYLTGDGEERLRERQMAVDLLTTNETYFFREPTHFDFVRDVILPARAGRALRCWSAASSSGEEAYSLAMILADHARTSQWRIDGTDISQRIIETARQAIYPLVRAERIPPDCLKRHCLKGIGPREGTLMIDRPLRQRVRFEQGNLLAIEPEPAAYDLIFLRNVMIYFDQPTKKRVLSRVRRCLKSDGYLFIGHSESLHGVAEGFRLVRSSIYQVA